MGITAVLLAGCGSSTAAGVGKLFVVRHMTNPTASDAPIFVAIDQGYFKQNGIDLQLQLNAAGGSGTSLLNGDTDAENLSLNGIASLRSSGKKLIAIYALLRRSTVGLVVSKAALASHHLSPTQPLGDRLRGLKGLRFGVTSPGSGNDVATRYLLQQGGLDPDKDAQVITVGSFTGQTSALNTNQIDAFVGPPPVPQQVAQQTGGAVLVSAADGEVPGLADFYFAVLGMRDDFVSQHADAVRGYDRALRQAYAYLKDHRDDTIKSIQKRLPNLDADTIGIGYDVVFKTFSPDGRFDPAVIKANLELYQNAKVIDTIPSLSEGVMWTNQYNP